MRKLSAKQTIATIGTAATVVAASGIAYAYWTTTGSGTGTGATTAGVTDTLSFTQDALADMYPGDSSKPLSVTIENTHADQKVYVTTVKAYLTVVGSGTCAANDFMLGGAAAPGDLANAVTMTWTAQELDPGESDEATSTIQFNNKATDQDGCKAATVTVHYDAS